MKVKKLRPTMEEVAMELEELGKQTKDA